MSAANTLAYYETATIMAVKSFIVQVQQSMLQQVYFFGADGSDK
jgi:hypothetical protein